MSVVTTYERSDLEARRALLLDRLGINGAELRGRSSTGVLTTTADSVALEELDEIDCLLTEDGRG